MSVFDLHSTVLTDYRDFVRSFFASQGLFGSAGESNSMPVRHARLGRASRLVALVNGHAFGVGTQVFDYTSERESSPTGRGSAAHPRDRAHPRFFFTTQTFVCSVTAPSTIPSRKRLKTEKYDGSWLTLDIELS